ncbi:MAG TPA: putative O-glycosylation ligase, exosortase A system-associated [Acetobacteraceae bacterium]|nr:putative O-glycosylation ligase, exosortase A system-associated [Acetobacteraceae bacterium]
MRSAALFLELLVLLPITLLRPFVGVLLWSWISFMNPHRLVYDGPALAVPWAMLTFGATVVGCVIAREPKRFPLNAVTVLIALFLVMISVTTLFAVGPWPEVEAKWEAVSKAFLFLLVTASLLTDRDRIHALIWVMALSLAFYGIKGGAFTILGGGANRVFGPDGTMIGDNNHLAVALLVSLPLMNYLRLESRHALIRHGFLATMVLTLFSVVGSYSRGALLALAAVTAYFWLKSSKKLVSGILLAAALAGALAFMPENWLDRMHTIGTYEEDSSATSRLDIWHTAWRIAVARPLTGGGFYAPYSQPVVDQYDPGAAARAVHSIWFEVLGEQGFPTFFVWVGISVAGAIYARRIISRTRGIAELAWCANLARMVQVSMIAYLVGGSFLSLCYWDYYFTLLAIVSALYQHVTATLGSTAARPVRLAAAPSRLAALPR